ncbi:MAG: amidohydrolase [Candidatus Omnitrophica bacterium]|nr:amidohydrolase [Candidatus Omnitrophota bacterium]
MIIANQAKKIQSDLVEFRRKLHRHPEPSYKEVITSSLLIDQIRTLGYNVREKQGGMGVVADLAPYHDEGFVLIRADMDSLPIQEESGEPFSSEIPNQAHLCGHDAHSTMALGAARLLAENKGNLRKNVRIVFQSAEEIPPGGALELIEAGALEGVEEAYALHVDPRIPTGQFGSRPGPMMASVNEFQITIQGKGGHAAYPHLASDPIVAASRLIVSLQEIISRKLPPLEPGVVSVCEFHAGSTFNVIPDRAELRGTTRFYSKEWVEKAKDLIHEIAEGACAGTGCQAEVEFLQGYPPLINHVESIEKARETLARIWSEDTYQEVELQGAGEDFARFLEKVPGCMLFIGIRNEQIGSTHFLHSPHFRLDEDCLWRGAAFLAQLALK